MKTSGSSASAMASSETFNVPPAAGRWPLAQDQVGATRPPPSVFKAYTRDVQPRYWQRRFGGDPRSSDAR
jgi:hypothetical protein